MQPHLLFAAINSHQYLYLLDLGEPEDNVLRVVIAEGPVAQPDRKRGTGPSNTAAPIVADDLSARYELLFESYVAYSVVNESFTVVNEKERFEGTLLRVYSESPFLEYVKAGTIASNEYGGPFEHYGIVCLNHIIEVAAAQPPLIKLINAGASKLRAVPPAAV